MLNKYCPSPLEKGWDEAFKLFLQINSLLMRKLSMDELNRKSVDEVRRAEKIPVIALLENIRSAYNVGSVFRTADAFLIEAVYITGYTAKPPHKEISKTALGAQESVEWKYFEHTKIAIEELRQNNFEIFAVEQVADLFMFDAKLFRVGQVLVLASAAIAEVTARRRDALRKAIKDKAGALLWRFASAEDVTPEKTLHMPIWYACGDEEPKPLVKQ